MGCPDHVLAADEDLAADQAYERMVKKWNASVQAEDQRTEARLQKQQEDSERMMQLEQSRETDQELQDESQPEKREASPYVRVEKPASEETATH